jgi:hypothetical protein
MPTDGEDTGRANPRYPQLVAKARASSDDSTSSNKPTATRGRATPPKSRDVNKRYTAPIPKSVRHSPRWFGPVLLALLVAGLLVIVGNYVGIMPGGTSNWYLIGGLVGIVVGSLMATQYH